MHFAVTHLEKMAHPWDREGGTFFYKVLIKKTSENGRRDVAIGQQNPC